MKTSPKQKVTLSLDRGMYEELVRTVGRRKVGAYISQTMQQSLSSFSTADSYRAMAEYEKKYPNPEIDEWLEAPLDETLAAETQYA